MIAYFFKMIKGDFNGITPAQVGDIFNNSLQITLQFDCFAVRKMQVAQVRQVLDIIYSNRRHVLYYSTDKSGGKITKNHFIAHKKTPQLQPKRGVF